MVAFTHLTKTKNWQFADRPCESVAVAVTIVSPTGKECGEVMTVLPIVYTGVTGSLQEATAVVEKLTVAVGLPGSVVANMSL
jgi:hypothetical protein